MQSCQPKTAVLGNGPGNAFVCCVCNVLAMPAYHYLVVGKATALVWTIGVAEIACYRSLVLLLIDGEVGMLDWSA